MPAVKPTHDFSAIVSFARFISGSYCIGDRASNYAAPALLSTGLNFIFLTQRRLVPWDSGGWEMYPTLQS